MIKEMCLNCRFFKTKDFQYSKRAPASYVSVVINDALDRATVAQDTHGPRCGETAR